MTTIASAGAAISRSARPHSQPHTRSSTTRGTVDSTMSGDRELTEGYGIMWLFSDRTNECCVLCGTMDNWESEMTDRRGLSVQFAFYIIFFKYVNSEKKQYFVTVATR